MWMSKDINFCTNFCLYLQLVKIMAEQKIDIVILWVDGSDEDWLRDFNQYASDSMIGDKQPSRFRDWDLLQYWFRGIEKFMPWVNRIHFITSGHVPAGLNMQHPLINLVKHSDFIPGKYLPTFNANTIELNIHRIKDLSEQFIYFNDDLFVLKSLTPGRFFQNGLPCDYGVFTAKPSGGGIIHIAVNDLEVLESHFDKHAVIKKNLRKWFNIKYGKELLNNLLLYPWKEFSGFIDPHLTTSFLKSTFTEVWGKAPDILDSTCRSKFRTNNDVNQWLMRYWQLAEGRFYPYNLKNSGTSMDITDNSLSTVNDFITDRRFDMICLNDSDEVSDFEKTKALLKESFEKILPDKSSFELD